MTGKPRVLIADDHLIVREGLRLILEGAEDFLVVGEAADGAEAVRQVAALAPDVVLMDLRMPGMDGLEALRHIGAEFPGVAVVVLTTFNEDDLVLRALAGGARGYLLKDSGRETLLDAVRAAARGETLLGPSVLARALGKQAAGAGRDPTARRAEGTLSAREVEVLGAVARGLRNKEIADRLSITERTVKAHLASIFNKLAVESRAGAVSAGIREGFIDAGTAADDE
jgi:two-component system, NarL family, response regulator YdfI